MSRKARRGLLISLAIAILAASGLLMMSAMRDNIVFFHTPSDIQGGKVMAGKQTRIGGLVEKDSIQRQPDGMDVAFRITDGASAINVRYRGILPDLFREQQGVVAEGLVKDGDFEASTILAKHDENYMPREVSEALKNNQMPPTGR
ncbi:MAG: cytochrome c maturation protein CcmE [Hyphomicrobium sp.]|nr:cytochrome c maturation protein CcmE [Hyphomicrobium sp.]